MSNSNMSNSNMPDTEMNNSHAQNKFNLFGLAESFDVDVDRLEKAYLDLSSQFHPDKNPQASSRQKLEMTVKTADLNKAYETLKDPLTRGYHLLTIKASHLDADSEKTIRDPDLLLEALEDQEALDEMQGQAEVEAFIEKASKKVQNTLSEISKAFKGNDFDGAMIALYRLRYYQKTMKDGQHKQALLKPD